MSADLSFFSVETEVKLKQLKCSNQNSMVVELDISYPSHTTTLYNIRVFDNKNEIFSFVPKGNTKGNGYYLKLPPIAAPSIEVQIDAEPEVPNKTINNTCGSGMYIDLY